MTPERWEALIRQELTNFERLGGPKVRLGEPSHQGRGGGGVRTTGSGARTSDGSALGLDPALARAPVRIAIVMELSPLPPSLYERGVGVVTFRTQRVADATPASGATV